MLASEDFCGDKWRDWLHILTFNKSQLLPSAPALLFLLYVWTGWQESLVLFSAQAKPQFYALDSTRHLSKVRPSSLLVFSFLISLGDLSCTPQLPWRCRWVMLVWYWCSLLISTCKLDFGQKSTCPSTGGHSNTLDFRNHCKEHHTCVTHPVRGGRKILGKLNLSSSPQQMIFLN